MAPGQTLPEASYSGMVISNFGHLVKYSPLVLIIIFLRLIAVIRDFASKMAIQLQQAY